MDESPPIRGVGGYRSQVNPMMFDFSITQSARLRRELSRTLADWDYWNLHCKDGYRQQHLFGESRPINHFYFFMKIIE